jgi:hypothetical protein
MPGRPSWQLAVRRGRPVLLLVVALASLGSLCDPPARATEISRERAIEIASREVSFDADSVEAVQVTSAGRPVWRVTFKGRLPGQPPELFETLIVEIDRRTEEIVSLSTT